MGIADLFIDTSEFPDDFYGFFQLLCILAVYGYILMNASNMISDGSELLLLVPQVAGIVGSIVLPVLGAVPDGALVLFSGLGPDAQDTLNVGVGSLAGSTIMLLTVPWFLSIMGGRVDVVNGVPQYKAPKLAERCSFLETGVSVSPVVNARSLVMLLTAIPYLVLQIPALFYKTSEIATQAKGEKPWSLVGFLICMIFFCAYMFKEYRDSMLEGNIQDEVRLEYWRSAITQENVTLIGVMAGVLKKDEKGEIQPSAMADLTSLLKPFFKRYDIDDNGMLDVAELQQVFHDLGEKITSDKMSQIFNKKVCIV
jgi:hypothetical protein